MNQLKNLGFLILTSLSMLLASENSGQEQYDILPFETKSSYDANNAIVMIETNETIKVIEPVIINENNNRPEEIVAEKNETERSPYLKALERAKSEKKIIMLAIRARECHYCDRMEAETLSDSSVQVALDANFITLHYDQDLEVLPLGLHQGVTPNFVFVNTNEDIINQYPGMRTPEQFKEALLQILAQ